MCGIRLQFIQPGKPEENAFIKQFNKTYRDELLDAYVFDSIEQVRRFTESWLHEYQRARVPGQPRPGADSKPSCYSNAGDVDTTTMACERFAECSGKIRGSFQVAVNNSQLDIFFISYKNPAV